jgi:hypothetical protein
MKITFSTKLPPTLNDQINAARRNKFASASIKEKETNRIASESKGLPKFEGKIWVDYLFTVKNFGRDPDNIEASKKYLMDGLVKSGVISKDSLMVIEPVIVERFEKGKVDTVSITISDKPIWTLTLN